ncbi:MAG: DUF502 domain-containing protein [Candidatus Neomarinimicrobiota bacterium]
MGAKIRRIFLAGIITAIPVYITIGVLQFLFRFVDRILAPVVQRILGVDFPGLGLVLMVVALFLLGLFVTNFLGRRLYAFFERMLLRIPLVSNVYNTTKQLVQTFSPEHRKAFQAVIWLEYPRRGLWTLGFVTGTTSSADGVPYYNVFVPTTPNPTSGYVVFAPQSETIKAALTIEEGFKLLISGGALSGDRHHFQYSTSDAAPEASPVGDQGGEVAAAPRTATGASE